MDRKCKKWDIEKKREIFIQIENNEVKKFEGEILRQLFFEVDQQIFCILILIGVIIIFMF